MRRAVCWGADFWLLAVRALRGQWMLGCCSLQRAREMSLWYDLSRALKNKDLLLGEKSPEYREGREHGVRVVGGWAVEAVPPVLVDVGGLWQKNLKKGSKLGWKGRHRYRDFVLLLPREHGPVGSLTWTQWKSFQTSDLQNCKIISSCYVKPWSVW